MTARSTGPYRTPLNEFARLRARKLGKQDLQLQELQLAVNVDHFEATKDLLERGCRDYQNDNGQTALLLACQNGSLRIAKLLLEYGSDASIADNNGYTPLHFLCAFPDEDIGPLCSLLEGSKSNIDVEAFSSQPYLLPDFFDTLVGTPLQWATAAGNLTAVNALLELGASATNAPAWLSPIQLSSSLFLTGILEALLKKTSPAIAIESHGLFFLNEAHPFRPIMIHGKELPRAIHETIKLLSLGQITDIATPLGTTALMKIALTNISMTDDMIVQELLKFCDTRVDGPQYSTIQAGIMGSSLAPFKSLYNITRMLIEAGFSMRAVSSQNGSWPGWNAMHWAVSGPYTEIVELLHEKDPELLEIQTDSEIQDYPLHIAAASCHGAEMVQLLLRLGAHPCAANKLGVTALANCFGETRPPLDMQKFSILLEANAANGYIVDVNSGSNLLHFVALRAAKLDQEGLPGHDLLRFILQRPEISNLINQRNIGGNTPLHVVCLRPDYASIRLLVEAGADVHCKTDGPHAMSPLDLVLEGARVRDVGLAGKDFDLVWHKFAYCAACYLSDRISGTPQDKKLSRLHMAAYCGYFEEVRRLVEEEGADLEAKDVRGLTPLLLMRELLRYYHDSGRMIDEKYLRRAQPILVYLNNRRKALVAR